ncbi:D-alanyl-D-alanine carboxypeptidase, partial [Bacillus cereus]
MGVRSVIVLKGFDEMVYMKVILTSYMYIEFDNTVYFLRIMLEERFLSTKILEVTEV